MKRICCELPFHDYGADAKARISAARPKLASCRFQKSKKDFEIQKFEKLSEPVSG
jgi:hypothetical protein